MRAVPQTIFMRFSNWHIVLIHPSIFSFSLYGLLCCILFIVQSNLFCNGSSINRLSAMTQGR